MYIMNNIIKYIFFYTSTLAVIRITALPISSEVIKPNINYGVISEENIHTESKEDFTNEEEEVNRSKKSATTFCVEIKSGTPECVPCQPVMMGTQPQVVYMTDNITSSDSNIINDTVTHRLSEVVLPPEPPCTKDEIFLILPPQQVQPTVSMVQVPVVHQVSQSPQILVATKPFLQTHFPELLNESNVQIQPLMPVDESLPIIDSQFPQLVQSSSNPFAINNNDNWNLNLNSKQNTYPQAVMPPSSEFKLPESLKDQSIGENSEFGVKFQNQPPFLRPPEYQNMGQNFGHGAVTQQHPSLIGSLENHEAGANLEFGVEVQNQPFFLQPPQHQNIGQNTEYGVVPQHHPSIGMRQNFGLGVEVQHQPSFMINQQGPAFNGGVVQSQQFLPVFMDNHASGQKFVNGGVGQMPIREPVKSQRPVNANNFQTHQGYFANMNVVMGQDGMNYYLVPAMINGNPQLCLQPEPITNPSLHTIHQQFSTQHENLSTPDSQQSSSVNKPSREIKDSKGTLKNPEAQTTVAPIKSGLKSQHDAKGKGGSSSLLNHLKGSSSLSKVKTLGKGQNKDSKTNDKSDLKRGNKRETEILIDK